MFPFVRPLNIHPPTGATGATGPCDQSCDYEYDGTEWIIRTACPAGCTCEAVSGPGDPQIGDIIYSNCIPFGD